jgi:hypothetical protein
MLIEFFRPISLGSSMYGAGVHDVPVDLTKNNWFFNSLVAEGYIKIIDDQQPEPPTTEQSEPEQVVEEIQPEEVADQKPKKNK